MAMAEMNKTVEERRQEFHDEREIELTPADEKKLVRKLDLHLIPLIMALYLFSFLDR